ncbi:DUF6182 family protein [Actinomadura rubrisoli]|uniref:Uncharacterized protein n=1 Tax=Actinomadura rubrisoli TaxID=2530368 RepID=A0A4R5CDH5_9ACTN|nr:DUF6182 family protein [Actinomadura rubrisoli]TDD96350.1 hypothetical protein E1298_03535 [Actinomadura rubrisoli]
MLDQATLRAALDDRISRAHRAWPSGSTGIAAIAVLRDFTPATFAGSAVAFAARIVPQARAHWYAGFTRTIFLAGNPRNLKARFPPDHLSEDGSIAWYGPVPLADYQPLRRMLRPLQGTVDPAWPTTSRVPLANPHSAAGTIAHLRVATQGLTLQDYLIHINHTLAEAVLDGLLTTADALTIEHMPQLPDDPGPYQALRISTDPQTPDHLRAYTTLSVHLAT